MTTAMRSMIAVAVSRMSRACEPDEMSPVRSLMPSIALTNRFVPVRTEPTIHFEIHSRV